MALPFLCPPDSVHLQRTQESRVFLGPSILQTPSFFCVTTLSQTANTIYFPKHAVFYAFLFWPSEIVGSFFAQAWPFNKVKYRSNNIWGCLLSLFCDCCLCLQVLTITLLLSWIALLAWILLLLWWITLLLGWSLICILLLTILRVSCKMIARKQKLIKIPTLLIFFPL